MTYTLKLDWTYERALAVVRILQRSGSSAAGSLAGEVLGYIRYGRPGDEFTIKLDWDAADINLARAMLQPTGLDPEAAPALRDIDSYLHAAAEAGSPVAREALGYYGPFIKKAEEG